MEEFVAVMQKIVDKYGISEEDQEMIIESLGLKEEELYGNEYAEDEEYDEENESEYED